jgi:hypothetical protein
MKKEPLITEALDDFFQCWAPSEITQVINLMMRESIYPSEAPPTVESQKYLLACGTDIVNLMAKLADLNNGVK